MAKLTRTQKFADLRDSLANDKEPSLSTKELSAFEKRLTPSDIRYWKQRGKKKR